MTDLRRHFEEAWEKQYVVRGILKEDVYTIVQDTVKAAMAEMLAKMTERKNDT